MDVTSVIMGGEDGRRGMGVSEGGRNPIVKKLINKIKLKKTDTLN